MESRRRSSRDGLTETDDDCQQSDIGCVRQLLIFHFLILGFQLLNGGNRRRTSVIPVEIYVIHFHRMYVVLIEVVHEKRRCFSYSVSVVPVAGFSGVRVSNN